MNFFKKINFSKIYIEKDIFFMKKSINLAKKALSFGDFPVGCIIECHGKIVSYGIRKNSFGKDFNELDHAEINALRNLSNFYRYYYRNKLTLYSTLEPCLMCLGAILVSGITRVVFAYEDIMGGSTLCDLKKMSPLYKNFDFILKGGVLRKQSLKLFNFFFNINHNYLSNSIFENYTFKQFKFN